MKRQVKANELVGAEIDFVSLVGKGANKRKFSILKAEDINQPSLARKLSQAVFGQPTVEKAGISAIVCTPAQESLAIEVLKRFDLKHDDVVRYDDRLIFKQEGFTPDLEGSMIALNGDVLVAFDKVIKYFDSYPESTDFNQNLVAGSFYPGMRASLETLGDTVFNIMMESGDSSDAQNMISAAVDAFASHMRELAASLPTTVFKMDALGFNSEEMKMNLAEKIAKGANLSEAQAGDLAGLMDEPKVVVKEDAAPAAPVVAEEVKTDAVPAEVVKETAAVVDDEPKEEDELPAAAVTAEAPKEAVSKDEALVSALTGILDRLSKMDAKLDTQSAKIEAVEAKADQAVVKANRQVIVDYGFENEQLATMRGHKPVQKSDASAPEDLWGGLMGQLDGFKS